MHNIVGVRYRHGCKVYNFEAADLSLSVGDKVIVDSEQGLGVAEVASDVRQEERPLSDKPLKPVLRKANDEDLRKIARNEGRESEAFRVCQQKILEREMLMKLVRVEWAFDNSKATFYFTADGRVDFRDLVKDLAHRFKIRIEMRQIGVRDEAKMIGGFGPCGRPLCCSSFLKDFEPVSIKMAKKQDLVLNPAKISGVCGRLMCCLGYEYSFYDEVKKDARKAKDARERPDAGAAPEEARPARKEQPRPAAPKPGEQKASDKSKRKRSAWRKHKKKGPGDGEGGDSGPAPAPTGDGPKPTA